MTSSFNLIDEPWIGARTIEGEARLLSIADVFHQAATLERLANETPTQDFAILRLLLAILYRSVERGLGGDEDPIDLWCDIWADGEPRFESVDDYLAIWHDRFDLFSCDYPFMQVPGLSTPKGSVSEVTKIVGDHPDGKALFSIRGGEALDWLSYAEAARWLVHVHAFDTAGIKSGVIGDPLAKGGKSYKSKLGIAGRLGGVCCESNTLAKTLILNLVLCDGRQPDELLDYAEDLPAWERGPSRPTDEGRMPKGVCDVFTWQSRRVRLIESSGLVNGVVLSNGDSLEPQALLHYETMSRWKRNPAQEKKLGKSPIYLPYQHQVSRAFWRGLTALLPQYENENGANVLTASVIRWIGELTDERYDVLPLQERVSLHAVGMAYGTRDAVVSEMIDDSVTLSLYLLSESGKTAVLAVVDCLTATDEAVAAYGSLAWNLQVAMGGSTAQAKAAAEKARSDAYFGLDTRFRMWVLAIDESTDLAQAQRRWQIDVSRYLMGLRTVLMGSADTKALLGRSIKSESKRDGKKSIWMSAGRAERIFMSRMRKVLPLAFESKGES